MHGEQRALGWGLGADARILAALTLPAPLSQLACKFSNHNRACRRNAGSEHFVRGAYSVLMSGVYVDDEDMGEAFWYTGEGGMDGKKQVGGGGGCERQPKRAG